jgi:hypothetical protein
VLLLNLAYVPDQVITGHDMQVQWDFNFDAGWQFYFKKRMQEYIDHFNEKVDRRETVSHHDGEDSVYDVKWKFQDEELEERYKVFKERRERELHVERPDEKAVARNHHAIN